MSRLLVDTHALLWWLTDDPALSPAARDAIADPVSEPFVSAASVWEIAIKRSLGKLEAPEDLAATLLAGGAEPLPIGLEHAAAVETLPWHHRDPFDRLLIAQAMVERAALVSHDAVFSTYDLRVVW